MKDKKRIIDLGIIILCLISSIFLCLTGDVFNERQNTIISRAESENSKIVNSVIDLNSTPITDFTQFKTITNYRYFYLNPLHHSNYSKDLSEEDKYGVCSTVAMQMLMGYHNYYSHRGIIPISTETGALFLSNNYGILTEHPFVIDAISTNDLGYDSLGTSDAFFDELRALSVGEGTIDQFLPFVKSGALEFIALYSSEDIKDDISMTFSVFSNEDAKAEIQAGRPLILCYNGIELENDPTTDEDNEKSYHVVVAYGYAKYNGEDGFIVHMGYGADQTQVWVPASWFGYQITMSVDHTHTFVDKGINHAYAYREVHCSSCNFKDLDDIYDTDTTGTKITGVNYPITDSILTIPKQIHFKDIVSIGNNAFVNQGVELLMSEIEFEVGSLVSNIGEYAFTTLPITKVNCKNATSLVSVGKGAFKGCDSLLRVEKANYLQTIGEEAFCGCLSLEYVTLSETISYIGQKAFNRCNSCTFTMSVYNPNYSSSSNILYDENQTTIIASGAVSESVKIRDTVIKIEEYAFEGNTNIQEVTFNANQVIYSYAFANCTNLQGVYFYTYEAPYMQANAFSQQDFTVYCPYTVQDSFRSAFASYTTLVDSRQLDIEYRSDGSVVDTVNVYYGALFNGIEVSKLGYDFVGWYDASSGGKLIEDGDLIDTYEDFILYAYWSEPLIYLANYVCEKGENANPINYTVETENLAWLR